MEEAPQETTPESPIEKQRIAREKLLKSYELPLDATDEDILRAVDKAPIPHAGHDAELGEIMHETGVRVEKKASAQVGRKQEEASEEKKEKDDELYSEHASEFSGEIKNPDRFVRFGFNGRGDQIAIFKSSLGEEYELTREECEKREKAFKPESSTAIALQKALKLWRKTPEIKTYRKKEAPEIQKGNSGKSRESVMEKREEGEFLEHREVDGEMLAFFRDSSGKIKALTRNQCEFRAKEYKNEGREVGELEKALLSWPKK